MSAFLDALQWRYATKKFDPSKKLSDAQLDALLAELRLAPSSYGLQPYKFLVISDPALRAKLREASWGQPQITEASHLVVMCARTDLGPAYVDEYLKLIADERGVPADSLNGFREILVGFAQNMSQETILTWAKKQVYIALGVLLSAAALAKVDACPMEGFEPAKYDEILGLKAMNLTSTVVCPLGFRSADDAHASMKKVRFPASELFVMKK